MAVSLEDVWSGPKVEGFQSDIYIKWRVEGTEGVAQGTIGWPDYPAGSPSTLRYCSLRATDGAWVEPNWDTMWFPHAFKGVMGQLQDALHEGKEPMLSGARQRQDDGAGRGRLPLDARKAARSSWPSSATDNQGERHAAGRHLHRLLPLLAGRDGEEDPGPGLQHRAARPALQGHRLLDAGIDHGREGQAGARDLPRPRPADLLHLGLHQHRPSRPGGAQAAARPAQGDHQERPPFRLALRHLRDRHLQHRIRTGCITRRTRPRKASPTAAR